MAAGPISSFRADCLTHNHESGSSYFQSSVFGGEFHEVKQGKFWPKNRWGRYLVTFNCTSLRTRPAKILPLKCDHEARVRARWSEYGLWRQLHTESN
jgi:hypothetical protein